VQDTGGDVLAIIGDRRSRPGLINSRGLPLDEAALKAWEAGYFFGPERPSINDLLDLIEQDGRIPVYPAGDLHEEKRSLPRDEIATELLARIVAARRGGGVGKRKALRPLMREAEKVVMI
jgi:hypothetical protein